MPDVGTLLRAPLESTFRAASGELAETLGGPVSTTVDDGKLLSQSDLRQMGEGSWLVFTGALAGAASGPVAFAMRKDHAFLLARQAEQAEFDPPGDLESQPLSEEDVAAVAFALARIGAAATTVWADEVGQTVEWPAEPTAFSPVEHGPGACAHGLQAAIGSGRLGAWTIGLGEPAGIELWVVVPEVLGLDLARLTDTDAQWARAAESATSPGHLARLLPVELPIRVVVGRRTLTVRELLQLVPGCVLDLEKRCDQPLDLYAGAKLVAHGVGMLVDERFGFRVTDLASRDAPPARRHKLLR